MRKPNLEWQITLPDNLTIRQTLALMATFDMIAEHDHETATVVFHPRLTAARCPTQGELRKAIKESPPAGLGLRVTR